MKTTDKIFRHSLHPAGRRQAGVLALILFLTFLPAFPPPLLRSCARAIPAIREAAADQGKVKLTVEDFNTEMIGNDGESHTLITGKRAVVYENDIYVIDSPKVVLTVERKTESEVEVGGKPIVITLTARNAELDEKNKTIRMSDAVEAQGPDFELHTESIRYDAGRRVLLSNDDVELKRYERAEEEDKWLAFRIKGRGLVVELPTQSVTIGGESTTTIDRVSEQFFASEARPDPDTDDEHQTVTIVARGNMVYSHLLQRIDYFDKVRVSLHERQLDADKLEINVDLDEESESLDITRIDATGNISFRFEDWLATGDELEWQNFTQIGKIQGNPARLFIGPMKVAGNEMSFFRLSNQLRINGRGRLDWEGDSHEPVIEMAPAPQMAEPGSFLATDRPVVIEWEGGMVYSESGGGKARFEKRVTARQGDSILRCDSLEINLSEGAMEVVSLHARKNVHYQQDERKLSSSSLLWDRDSEKVIASGDDENPWVRVTEPARQLRVKEIHFGLENNSLLSPSGGLVVLNETTDSQNNTDAAELRLEWSESMKWDGEGTASFHGAVQSSQPGRQLNSDSLEVMVDAEMTPVKLVARGNAILVIEDAPPIQTPDGTGDENGADPEEGDGENGPSPSVIPGAQAGTVHGARWKLTSEHLEGLPSEETIRSLSAGTLTVEREGRSDDRIEWTEGMVIDLEELYALFEGDVEAEFSEARLKCSRLRMDLDENRQLRYLNAEGKMLFVAPGEYGWQLSADNASAVFASGGQLDHLIARTGVKVIDAERRLMAEQLRLFFAFNPSTGANTLTRALAREKVMVWYEEGAERLHARGDELQWTSSDDRYELKGKPAALSRDGIAIEGEYIVIDRSSGEVSLPRGSSPVETRIQNR